jgi:hypothetical protein
MSAADELFYVGIEILKTTVDKVTGAISAQIGDVLQEIAESDDAEWWQQAGLVSRPPRPVAKKLAAQAIGLRRRGRDILIACRDLRGLKLAGELDDGETCLYAPGPDGTAQGRILIKKDGSIHLYTRAGNTPDGGGMIVTVDPTTDTIALVNAAGYGLIIDGEGARLTAKGAAVALTPAGDASLIGKGMTQVDGASIVIGSVAVPVANAALKGPTGIAGTPSLKTVIE